MQLRSLRKYLKVKIIPMHRHVNNNKGMLIKNSLFLFKNIYNSANIYMFIKPYTFLIEKKGQRFVYICTPHQVKKNTLKEQKGRESMSSRHELQKHSDRWKISADKEDTWMFKYKRVSLQTEFRKNILRNIVRKAIKAWS